MMSAVNHGRAPSRPGRQTIFAAAVRFVIAPLILLSSGFFTAGFLLSGHYTWPWTSRVMVLTITVIVLAYEFVYQEQRSRSAVPEHALSAVLYSCVIPYAAGVLLLLGLTRFGG
jgi:hypothetical protein